jgi:hypothetical protein
MCGRIEYFFNIGGAEAAIKAADEAYSVRPKKLTGR